MVSPVIKPEEISQWLNIPTLHMHYKHNWTKSGTQLNHLEALKEYFIYNDLSISYNVLFAEAKFLNRIFPNIKISYITKLLREIGNEPNRIRVVAKKLCFLKSNGCGKSVNDTLHNKQNLLLHMPELPLTHKRSFEQKDCLENDLFIKKSKSDTNENNNNNIIVNNVELKKAIEDVVSKIDQETPTYFPGIAKSISMIKLPEKTLAVINSNDAINRKNLLPQQYHSSTSVENETKGNIKLACSYSQGLCNSFIDSVSISSSKSNNSKSNQRVQYLQYAHLEQIETITSTTMFNKQNVQNVHTEEKSSAAQSTSAQHSSSAETYPTLFDIFNEEPHQNNNCSLMTGNFSQHTINSDVKGEFEVAPLQTGASSTMQTENKNVPFAIVPSTSKENFVPSFNRMPDKHVNNSTNPIPSHSQCLLDNATHMAYDNFPTSTTPINMIPLKEIADSINLGTIGEPSGNTPGTSKITQLPDKCTRNTSRIMNIEKPERKTISEILPIDLTVDIEEESEQLEPIEVEENETNPLVYQLMEIFPDACPTYLRRMCRNRTVKSSEIDILISEILSSDYPRRQNVEEEPKDIDVNELSEHLKELLPDADPSYLETKAEQLANNPNELKVFISNAFEHRDYPTLKEYLRRVQLSSQQKQYTTDFKVENFLDVIPDPFTYFRDPKRKSNVKDKNQDFRYVIAFLKNKYPQVPVKIISTMDIFKFNLIKVCHLLDNTMLMKSKRKPIPLPNLLENIPLLQEIAFIQHEEEIRSFITVQMAKEKQEREVAKQFGQLQTCQCCFDDEVMPKDIASCNEGCVFCKSCVSKSIEVAFGDGKLQFSCLSTCTSEFSLQTLQNVLNPKIFSKIALKKQVEEVKAAGIEDIESCPFCDFVTIPAKEDKLFRCLNPDCMKESCRQCKEPSHVPLRCDEVEKDEDIKARVYIENKMTEALIRKCHKCGVKFVKSDGCNKMTCSCGATMCYICNKPDVDYKHFNGQGGTNFNLCPLYSDTEKLHVENVLKSANEAKAELGKENLKIDPVADFQKHYKIESNKKSNNGQPYVDPFVLMNQVERNLQEQALNFFLRNENIGRLDPQLNRIDATIRQHNHYHHNHRHNVQNRRRH